MTCLKDETLAALARGVIPQGELGRIRAHLPECRRCLDAIARRSGSSSNPGDARRWAAPTAPPLPPPPAAPGRYRWVAVFAAMLTVVLSALWVAMPAGSGRAAAASAARGAAAVGAEARHVWRALRGMVGSPVLSEADATIEGTAPERATEASSANAPSPTTQPLLRDDAAASARVAEASRLVERANAAAALNQAAGGR